MINIDHQPAANCTYWHWIKVLATWSSILFGGLCPLLVPIILVGACWSLVVGDIWLLLVYHRFFSCKAIFHHWQLYEVQTNWWWVPAFRTIASWTWLIIWRLELSISVEMILGDQQFWSTSALAGLGQQLPRLSTITVGRITDAGWVANIICVINNQPHPIICLMFLLLFVVLMSIKKMLVDAINIAYDNSRISPTLTITCLKEDIAVDKPPPVLQYIANVFPSNMGVFFTAAAPHVFSKHANECSSPPSLKLPKLL